MTEEWHYATGGKTSGPVSAAELKRLADAGAIAPTDLVWKEGMDQWIQARAVKGLTFDATPAAERAFAPSLPARRAASRNAPAPPGQTWHPLDRVVEAARAGCPEDLGERISRIAGRVGVHSLSVAAALALAGGVLLAIRTTSLRGILTALGAGIAILVGQYVASRLLAACQAAITANRSLLASLAVPDCVFVLAVAATIAGVLGSVWQAVEGGQFGPLVAALAMLVAGGFTAVVAITPGGLGVDIDPTCRAAEEAVGIVTFLFKTALRCAPILFAAGAAFATYRLLETVILILRSDAAGLRAAEATAAATLVSLFTAIAVPIAAYLMMLGYYLTLDVIAAIVSLPGKLDRIARQLAPVDRDSE